MKVSIVLKGREKTRIEECDEAALRAKMDSWIEEARKMGCDGIALTVTLYGKSKTTS